MGELSPSEKLTEQLLALLTLTHEDLPQNIKETIEDIVSTVGQLTISPLNGVPLICNTCYTINAAGYKLKRSAGKYIALCVDEFGGCAGKELHHKCNFVDHIGIECDKLAEYQIVYGQDKLLTRYACIVHAGVLLKDTEQKVYPLR